MYIEHKGREASEQILIDNSRTFLDSTLPSSDSHRAVKAVFAVSMKINPTIKNSLGNTRNLIQARKDFICVAHEGTLENRKSRPQGKSHVTDDVLENSIDVIVSSCSTVAWSMRRHVIKPGSKVITTTNIQKNENNGETVVFLPALH